VKIQNKQKLAFEKFQSLCTPLTYTSSNFNFPKYDSLSPQDIEDRINEVPQRPLLSPR